ncbi:MAG: DUF4270 domain-containing protein [Prevotella sp.]|jgi:hypothetical protein|nr:DUF4270 domain-containing protein [Prevotella sp.]
MKVKTLLTLAITSLAVVYFIACSDNLSELGGTIQPDGDGIFVGTETVRLTAETVSYKDSVYARTVYGILGEYIDPVVGRTKSDYMCEFYCPENMSFDDDDCKIDSVYLETQFIYYTGDTVAPMGVEVYAVKESLQPFFFTSVNPKKYIGENPELYGRTTFTVQDTPDTIMSSVRYRRISTRLKTSLGEMLYGKWKEDPKNFANSDKMKEFFKGIYVTTNFGSGTLVNVNHSQMNIFYNYKVRNVANTADSTVYSSFRLVVSPEVVQMNHVENDQDFIEELMTHKDTKTYMKTPAGVYTEITIPLNDIMTKIGKDKTINAANFKIKGYTEEEVKSGMAQPAYALLINKDSLPNFFYNRKLHDAKTSFVVSRNSSNTYDFGNLATIINHYSDYYKDEPVYPDLKYLIVPVSASTTTVSSSTVITDLYNLMYPTATVFRTDSANMRMSLIYSKYNR